MSNGRYEQQMVRKIEMAGLCGVRWKDVDCCGQVVGSPALCSGNSADQPSWLNLIVVFLSLPREVLG